MSDRHRFCAVESVAAGDPLSGTATHAEHNLLISWPRRKWTRNLRHASDMPPELIARLDTLAADGRRVNLIHRHGWPADHHRLYLFPEGMAFDVSEADLPDFLADLTAGHDLNAWRGAPVNTPVLLCCTHGKKDKCCARFGFATYRQLQAEIHSGSWPVELWESSHLGGCRLAASLMSFPSMRKYGRLGPNQVADFLAHEVDGQAFLPCYRGRSQLTPVQQCAEVAALERLRQQDGIDSASVSVGPEQTSPESGRMVQVSVVWQHGHGSGTLVVTCARGEVRRVDTCADLDAGPTPSLCWYVHRIEVWPDAVDIRSAYQSMP